MTGQHCGVRRNKNPILLPGEHRFTELITDMTHRHRLHGGVSVTLTELREHFWNVRGRQIAKRVIQQCKRCARFRVKPASAPVAPLPSDMVNKTQPFEVVGIDFAGFRCSVGLLAVGHPVVQQMTIPCFRIHA